MLNFSQQHPHHIYEIITKNQKNVRHVQKCHGNITITSSKCFNNGLQIYL